MFKSFLISLLIFSFIIPQKTYTFTEEEVLELYSSIKKLERADSLNVIMVENLEEQIELYKTRIENDSIIIAGQEEQLMLKDKLIEEIKPKWHENKYLWFGYGVTAILVPIWAIGQLK